MEENEIQEKILNTQKEEKLVKRKKIIKIIGISILVIIISLFTFFSYVYYKNKSMYETYQKELDANYNIIFASIPVYNDLKDCYKMSINRIFVDNNYLDGTAFLTKVPSRAKKIITYGSFSGNQSSGAAAISMESNPVNDIAFIVEKNDFKSSILFIMSSDQLLLFYKEYDNELPTITSFRKGQKIFLDETKLVPSPTDGVMLHFKNKKTALLYIPNTKTFEEYTQYSEQDLKNMENAGNGESEYSEGDEDSNDIIYKINDPDGYTNLREQKDTTSMILQKIPSGSIITILHDTGDWWDIETEEGKRGYVHKSKIKSE
jgi:hypothetical protein